MGSNAGGRSGSGSGVQPSYGGGRYYGGGARVPYAAGGRSPAGLVALGLLPIAGLAFFAGAWLYPAYLYPYSHPYTFHNASANNGTGANQTKPVKCLCQQYSVCGCDENDDQSYLASLLGNGSTEALNSSLVRVANVNNTDTIFLNGTLPNGTTAAGGSDSAAALNLPHKALGYVVIATAVTLAVFSL
ncbi:hypothetical protein EJ06DRAFT_362109 [Trichodelitschia bisporula]|uniref:DUF7732 domain-containing protein n=1 Tax=Trichodelitschia bisporula TaxID=703511 RepID=A0A6G1I0N1_9PEZI|nr:hypothetical protein EJ06DRAFT_362109 [Trichodelitschia bisporula]